MVNIELPVVKRYNADVEVVQEYLEENGVEHTRSAAGGKVHYHEVAGIGVTLVDGPFGTLMFPSGPVRGRVFAEQAVSVGREPSFVERALSGEEGEKKQTRERSGSRGRTGSTEFTV